MLRYVDDLLISGNKKTTEFLFSELQKQVCLRLEGVLEPGTSICFLGRCSTRRDDLGFRVCFCTLQHGLGFRVLGFRVWGVACAGAL